MIDERDLEQAEGVFAPPERSFERFTRRRDRKRRKQRIAAGVVGIAVFVAAVWIVTSVSSLDRSQTSVVPGGDVTGPAETGPAVAVPTDTVPTDTGPTETGPTETGSNDYSYRIPPAGTAVSTPLEGELIGEANVLFTGYVRVYADGRVLSLNLANAVCTGRTSGSCPGGAPFVERRLLPEGVELVRSGAVPPERLLGWDACSGLSTNCDVPASVWEDREGKPYAPARYAACFRHPSDSPPYDEADLDLLPASAQALLRGSDPAKNPGCLEVTPEEARSLEELLSEAGLPRGDPWPFYVGMWLVRDGNGDQVEIKLYPLYPDGWWLEQPGG